MFYQIFFSPQVKRWDIIGYKASIDELRHKLPNELKLTNSENQEILLKCLYFIE